MNIFLEKKKVNRHITEDLKVSSDSDGFYGSDSLINGQKSFPSMKNCTVWSSSSKQFSSTKEKNFNNKEKIFTTRKKILMAKKIF